MPVVAEAQKPDSKLVLLKTSRMPVWLSKPLHSLPLEYPLLNVIPLSLGLVTHANWYRETFAVWIALLAASLNVILLRYRSFDIWNLASRSKQTCVNQVISIAMAVKIAKRSVI